MNIEKFIDAPLFAALNELNSVLEEKNYPPITLNVVGGFALMLHNVRNKNEDTDIDYVGPALSKEIGDISESIGQKHHLVSHWINNDLMLKGTTLEEMEFSTGKLHFRKSISLSKITVNALERKDLLRMKVIAIDTALSAIDNGGDFTRMKDFSDIIRLSKLLKIPTDSFNDYFGEYLINKNTVDIISTYETGGEEAVYGKITSIQFEYLSKIQKDKESKGEYKRSSFLNKILNSIIEQEEDLDDF